MIEALIGSRYLTLNNTIQDRSYIRQPLGYKLLAMAGLPNSRCNFARVFVNGTLIGQGVGGVNSPGIFVNAEAVMVAAIFGCNSAEDEREAPLVGARTKRRTEATACRS